MTIATILLQVDPESVRAFAGASAEERRKLELLLKLRLRELTCTAPRPLRQVMDEIGAYAETEGLTPEKLESLLHED